jgi:uncharacterized protein (TIGR02118 family)
MIKVYALLARRPDITAERFHEHWATTHREHALRITRLRRYVQAHRLDEELPGLAPLPYDGVPEVWYDSLESAVGQDEDPNYTEYAQRDEPNFVDMSRIAWVMTDERLVRDELELGEHETAAKVLILAGRRAGDTPEAFGRGWPQVAADVVAGLPGVRRAAVATTLAETYGSAGEPVYDGALELWWADDEALASSWAATGEGALRRIAEVADPGRTHGSRVAEVRVIWPGPAREPALNQQERP